MLLGKNNLTSVLLLFTIITLPFDSFPLPINSVYKPLSILPITVTFFYSLKVFKFKLFVKPLFIFFLVAIILTSLFNSFLIDDFSGFFKFFIEIIILLMAITSINFFFINLNNDQFKRILNRGVELVINLFVVVGTLQLISRYIDPYGIIEKIHDLFIYRHDLSRIQFFSGEPSMGIRMVVLFLSLRYYINKKFLFDLKTSWLLVLILISGSTFGLIYVFMFTTIFLLIKNIKSKKLIINVFFIVFTLIILNESLPLIKNFIPEYSKNKVDSLISVVNDFSIDNLLAIAQIDGSIFLRVFNPIIGFKIFLDNYILGVGGENFSFYYIDVISNDYPFALKHDTVASVYNGEIKITPKSLLTKLLSELGILGLFFLVFLARLCLKVKTYFLLPLSAYILTTLINYDSYIYYPLIFAICLLYFFVSHTKEDNNEVSF